MKLADGIYFVEGKNKGKYPYCNSLIVGNVIIDAGCGIDIVRELSQKVDILLLTHTHPDHAAGAWIFNETGKKVLSPDVETEIETLAKRFAPPLAEKWMKVVSEVMGLRSFKAEKYESGEVIRASNHEIEAIKVEGHTRDMHVFLIDGKILFGADVDLTKFGPWYGNPESDPEKFEKSVRKLETLDFEVYVSSHEGVFSREEALKKLEEFVSHFKKREEKILEALRTPKSLEELVKLSLIYGRKNSLFKDLLDYFEGNMIKKHLEILMRKGKVAKVGEKFVKN
ncbi:dehydrase, putative [Ferroglobus placidus DSM 10642]|uniref:Dehydrase, putative n=1 Tax=Ferroglobus placidus (strain DSM 10642 / AEDII12DO) TaxID=589924 RepID=D3S2F8_FERPA|nr:MBL fold metallo-hydrolase [Ferroglobus placidus]ADC64488.1 dehydrase, putative [Ferroglobus placidus DSM 10642]